MGTVKTVAQDIYDLIDNDLYHADGDRWWQSDSPLYLIQSSVNPARVGYFKKKLFNELKVHPQGKSALEVGCGGASCAKKLRAWVLTLPESTLLRIRCKLRPAMRRQAVFASAMT